MNYRLMQVNRFQKAASMQELRLSKAFSNGCATRILKLLLLILHWGLNWKKYHCHQPRV
jgi:hypothetical protein